MATARGTAALEQELAELQTRQLGLLEKLRAKRIVDPALLDDAEAVFSRLPEYTEKARRVRSSMDALAERTARMRQRLRDTSRERLHEASLRLQEEAAAPGISSSRRADSLP